MLNWSRLSLKRMCYDEACNNSVDSFYNRVNSRSSRRWGKCASRKKYLAKEASPSTFVQEMLSLKNMEQGCTNPAKQDGVVLGADTRATAGQIVCDKNCEKIHDLAPNISCCSADTSADTENLTECLNSNSTLQQIMLQGDAG